MALARLKEFTDDSFMTDKRKRVINKVDLEDLWQAMEKFISHRTK